MTYFYTGKKYQFRKLRKQKRTQVQNNLKDVHSNQVLARLDLQLTHRDKLNK